MTATYSKCVHDTQRCLLSCSVQNTTLWAHTNLSKSNLSQAYCVSPLILLLTNSIIKYDGLHTDRRDHSIAGSFWRLIWANIFLVALWNSIATNVTICASENSLNNDSVLGTPHTDVRYYTPWDGCLPCYQAPMKSHKQIWLPHDKWPQCMRLSSANIPQVAQKDITVQETFIQKLFLWAFLPLHCS